MLLVVLLASQGHLSVSVLKASLFGDGNNLGSFLQCVCHSYQEAQVYHTLSHSKLGLQQAETAQVVAVDGCLVGD